MQPFPLYNLRPYILLNTNSQLKITSIAKILYNFDVQKKSLMHSGTSDHLDHHFRYLFV